MSPLSSVFAMSTNVVVPLISPLGAEHIPFLSLPVLVHEHIVNFIRGGGEDVPGTYGASLMVLADVMPFFEEMVHRWFSSRCVTMLTVSGLRLRLSIAFPYTFNASPQLIRALLCRVCSFRSRTAFALIQHSFDVHPSEWDSPGWQCWRPLGN